MVSLGKFDKETERNRQTESDRIRDRQTEGDSDRKRWTKRDRQRDGQIEIL